MEYWFSLQARKEETWPGHKTLCSVYFTKKIDTLLPGVVLSLPLCSKLSWVFDSYKGCLSKLKPHFERKSLKWPFKPLTAPKLHPASEHVRDWPYPSPKKASYCFFCGLRRDHSWISFFLYSCSINIAWPRPISREAWVEEKHITKASNSTTSYCNCENYLRFAWFCQGQSFVHTLFCYHVGLVETEPQSKWKY